MKKGKSSKPFFFSLIGVKFGKQIDTDWISILNYLSSLLHCIILCDSTIQIRIQLS